MMFEQELYNNFNISLPKSYFITFAGDVSFPFLHRYTFTTFPPPLLNATERLHMCRY